MGAPKLEKDYSYEAVTTKSTKTLIEDTYTDELVIGICAPIGTDKKGVIEGLKNQLEVVYGYEVRMIKLSQKFIPEYGGRLIVESDKSGTASYQKMDKLICQGDKLRNVYGKGILVELAIDQIRLERERSDRK